MRWWPVGLLLIVAVAGGLLVALAVRPQPLPMAVLSPLPVDCFQEPTARLAQAQLGGQFALRSDGTLTVELWLPDHWPADQAAQAIWIAFEAAAAMPSACPYQQFEVLVSTPAARLRASVSAADLLAWAAGELSDEELVERVLYLEEPLPSSP